MSRNYGLRLFRKSLKLRLGYRRRSKGLYMKYFRRRHYR